MEIIALLLIGLAVFVAVKIRKANDSGIAGRRENIDRTVSPPVTTPFDPESAKATVQETHLCGPAYVVDGDTIKIRQTQIRLFGIDAPEMNHPYGKKAKWALVSMCKGQTVNAEILESDDYGRTVAKCTFDDGRDLSAEMVKLGLAIDWPKFSNGHYKDLEVADVRKRLWLADARQKGRMHVWDKFEAEQKKTAK